MWSIDDPGVSESPDYEREERDLTLPRIGTCRQCCEEYEKPDRGDDGFCSDSCLDACNAEVAA